jgi:hypothetical protein
MSETLNGGAGAQMDTVRQRLIRARGEETFALETASVAQAPTTAAHSARAPPLPGAQADINTHTQAPGGRDVLSHSAGSDGRAGSVSLAGGEAVAAAMRAATAAAEAAVEAVEALVEEQVDSEAEAEA